VATDTHEAVTVRRSGVVVTPGKMAVQYCVPALAVQDPPVEREHPQAAAFPPPQDVITEAGPVLLAFAAHTENRLVADEGPVSVAASYPAFVVLVSSAQVPPPTVAPAATKRTLPR
jgi:hypothetical protein